MASRAVADGITDIACTPHVAPGVYDNTAPTIRTLIAELSAHLRDNGVDLTLWMGGDVHIDPGLVGKLQAGLVPTLGDSRYLLLEPPHHIVPPRVLELVEGLLAVQYVPIITHPERLGWIETHYELFTAMVRKGALVQLTAGSITGGFGRRVKYLSERMLDEGLVDIIASDAHNIAGRPPLLSPAREAVARRLGEAEANAMVIDRPAAILQNAVLPLRQGTILPQTAPRQTRQGIRLVSWVKRLRG